MLWSALSRYSITYTSSEVDGQRTRKTFARFSRSAPKKKEHAKACVLREFLLLLFNAVSLFCSALFRKTMVFCLKMLPAKHQINMCISQYQKDARAAVRKGRARLREQGVLKAAVPSMRLSNKTVEWEVAKPQIKIGKFSSNSNICYFYLKLIASIGKTLSLKCFQISLANIKSVRHN